MNPISVPGAVPMRRRGLLATGALAAMLSLAGAAACADSRLVQVDVLDRDSGDTLHVWRDHGRPVIAGRPGARYAVRLVNTSGERVLAVVAIDGVNVVSGETAGVGQRGYVLEPWQRTEITGWRKSDDEVAAFEFTSLADSYAARTGRPLDVGVIGVAVFREKQRPVVPDERIGMAAPAQPLMGAARDAAAPAPAPPTSTASAGAAAPMQKALAENAAAPGEARASDSARYREARSEPLGTGHGARESSYASYTSFERESSNPNEVDSVWYDSYRNLVARGVIPAPRPIAVEPQPFPNQFVPDPAG
jgi:hypothetical protein